MSMYFEYNLPDMPRNKLVVVAMHCNIFGDNGKPCWLIRAYSYRMHSVLCVDTFEELMMWADMHCITIDKVIEDDENYTQFSATINKHLHREMCRNTLEKAQRLGHMDIAHRMAKKLQEIYDEEHEQNHMKQSI